MALSQRSQYAVRAVFELAKRDGSGTVKAASIAEAQYVPVRFLENILGQLRHAGIIDSVRGKDGGYRLSRPPELVSVGQVIRSVQGPLSAVDCIVPRPGDQAGTVRECALRPGCVLLPMWEKAHEAMMAVYDGTTFGDLVEQERAAHTPAVMDYAI
jgi:Rrf2 family protein